MQNLIYLRMRKNLEISYMKELLVEDIAIISTQNERLKRKIEQTPVYRISEKDKNLVVIDSFILIEHLTKIFEDLEIQLVGPNQTIIRVLPNKKNTPIWVISLVWLLLFIGAAMTIMNFHYDVSMQQVQQKLHLLVTGEENEFPLWIQIPYSLGLGIGTLLFFNHFFNKRFNEEPSPLEVEIHNYQQDLDNYLSHYENQVHDRKPSD